MSVRDTSIDPKLLEVRDTWIMNEKFMMDLFKMLWKIRDDFVLMEQRGTYAHMVSLQTT